MSPEATDGLLPLLVWTSPAFPVGAFAYSHGLEWAAECGAVRDAASLQGWLHDLVEHGAPRNDAILAACAWRAAMPGMREAPGANPSPVPQGKVPCGCRAGEGAGRGAQFPARDFGASEPPSSAPLPGAPSLQSINELALALAGSRERHLETSQQGNAFVLATRAAWPCAALDHLVDAVPGDIAYPIAFATAAAGQAVALPATLQAFAFGVVANLVSAAVRLGVIGQTDGQRVLASLTGPIRGLASTAAAATLDDLGAAAFASDIAALRHETQYSRLFRS